MGRNKGISLPLLLVSIQGSLRRNLTQPLNRNPTSSTGGDRSVFPLFAFEFIYREGSDEIPCVLVNEMLDLPLVQEFGS